MATLWNLPRRQNRAIEKRVRAPEASGSGATVDLPTTASAGRMVLVGHWSARQAW
jgi:hypothetical protein